jgi:hypothetical protein
MVIRLPSVTWTWYDDRYPEEATRVTHSRSPIAELVIDQIGTPVLHLYGLLPKQLQCIQDTMINNGHDYIHELRSIALAHLGKFDTHLGEATIHVHSDDRTVFQQFLALMSSLLGMSLPTEAQEGLPMMAAN